METTSLHKHLSGLRVIRSFVLIIFLFSFLTAFAGERETIWPKGKMPDAQSHQIAAMTDEAGSEKFKADKHRVAYLEWFEAPAKEVKNNGCMILISGGGYYNCCDVGLIKLWRETFTKLGFQCVNFVYRTPRPEGLPIYQTAWEDGQRAVRMVRSEAKKRGFDPEKIGAISMSAGSHLALLLATSSQTPAYTPVDKLDEVPCHLNWAIVNAPAYVTTDGDTGTPATRLGYGIDVRLSDIFKFDEKTCPISLHHGGNDEYTPNGSTLVYRELRKRRIPAELHLYPGRGHGAFGLERGIEFMRQMGFLGELEPEVLLTDRFVNDDARKERIMEDVWPEGRMPEAQEQQCKPYIEWHFPKELKTKAIQIIYSGGSYMGNDPDGFEAAPVRRYLNEKGMTVVTLKYRTPRPTAESGLAKHTSAWQDLQRTIRIVRSKAESYGLDPNQIGIMGSSAGGHLTLMGVTSSLHRAYLPIDDIDKQPCNVQWGIGIYPAYALTDGANDPNTESGVPDDAVLVPEFSFDLKTAPMLFLHGDVDVYAAMNSVKTWEKMRSMGIQSELHTLATRNHCFQRSAAPGTGSYTFLDRIDDFLKYVIKK
ncbi:MAG: alpha/beta hydrolase [Bacteroidaceae bacterium]|nr:alpha/beta hydrolase [Bacteroidaceae bacterium]